MAPTSLRSGQETSNDLGTIASRYPYLQGLRLVPIGFWLAASSVVGSAWWPWKGGMPARELAVMVPVTVVALGALAWLHRYYGQTFGRVVFRRQQRVNDAWVTLAGLLVLVAAAALDWRGELSVNVYGVAVGGLSLAYWHHGGILRRHHLVLAGAVVVVSVSPWGTVGAGPTAGTATTLLNLTVAAMFVVAGLLDHARLVELLGRPAGSGTTSEGTSEGRTARGI